MMITRAKLLKVETIQVRDGPTSFRERLRANRVSLWANFIFLTLLFGVSISAGYLSDDPTVPARGWVGFVSRHYFTIMPLGYVFLLGFQLWSQTTEPVMTVEEVRERNRRVLEEMG